jgi:hypothetical protein
VLARLGEVAGLLEAAGLPAEAARAREAAETARQDPEEAARVLTGLSAELAARAPGYSCHRAGEAQDGR